MKLGILGGGQLGQMLAKAASTLKMETLVLDPKPDAVAGQVSRHLMADYEDADALDELATCDAVTFEFENVPTSALERLGARVPVRPPIASLEGSNDRIVEKQLFQSLGIATAPFAAVSSRAELDAAIAEIGLPAVLKPRSAAGGRGVTILEVADGLEAGYRRAAQYGDVLVQRFVGGLAVGVEAFTWDYELRAAIVMNDQFAKGFVSPVGHSLPATVTDEVRAGVLHAVEAFGRALGLRHGPANFDVRWENGRAVLLEVNARLGGNSITDLVRFTHGLDLSAATVRAAFGQDPLLELRTRGTEPTASRLLVAPGEGIVRFAPGLLARLEAREGVRALDLTVADGEEPALRVDSHAVLGRVLTGGTSPEAAVERAAQIDEALRAGVTWESR